MKEFVSFLADMDDKGLGVIAVKNGLDTVSSSGRMMMEQLGFSKSGTVRCSSREPMQDLPGLLRMEPSWVGNPF